MALKFDIYKDIKGEWRWNAQSAGNIIFASGEGFEKPQKVVQVIRKNVVREDTALEASLLKALTKAGLNEKGGAVKAAAPLTKAPTIVETTVKKLKKLAK